MEITKRQIGGVLEIKLTGRLDNYWSEQLAVAIDEAIQAGLHDLALNMNGVVYVSSAGIRVLLKYYKQLKQIEGNLSVSDPSEGVASILELAGFATLLIDQTRGGRGGNELEPRKVETENSTYHVQLEMKGAELECKILGNPSKLAPASFQESDCHSASFRENTFGLGVGAFGENFADCSNRFGEFIAAGGIAACQPTDGTNLPDYMISEGLLVPELEVLYGLSLEGSFSHIVRFESNQTGSGVTPLSEIAETVLKTVGAEAVGMVILAESAGLVGATLKQPPLAGKAGETIFSFPLVREWISFTAERAYDRAFCVIAGVAATGANGEFGSMLRSLGKGSLVGHFHAAAFPYRALSRGRIDLSKTLTTLFGTESLQSVLHLLADDRELEGVGESELLRGACFVAPIKTSVRTEEAKA